MLALKAVAGWCAVLACAVVNGALREFVLAPALGATAALLLSGALLCALVLVVALALVPWFGRQPASRYVAIGLLWLGLTVAFEFGFGRARGASWTELLAAYTFEGGNLWPLVLGFVATAPLLAARMRGAG